MPHEFKDDTLDDIKSRDILNLEVFLKKKGRDYKKFDSSTSAHAFQGIRLATILDKLGISLNRASKDDTYDIQGIMDRNGIKVESRIYEEDEDEWRSGMYIYKDNEIAGFIGFPIFSKLTMSPEYKVLCTVKV